MEIFHLALITTTLLCSLVAGFLFAFAVVIMPGISSLSDQDFIRAFRAMDRVIQKNQPIFMLVWIGSIIMLIISTILAILELPRVQQVLLFIATLARLRHHEIEVVPAGLLPCNQTLQKFPGCVVPILVAM